jgi:hypothetical protein
MCGISWKGFDMTDEQITAPNPAERLRVMIAALSDSGQGCFSKESLRAILAHIDAQAAEIARLREQVALLHNVIARAALAQETQP